MPRPVLHIFLPVLGAVLPLCHRLVHACLCISTSASTAAHQQHITWPCKPPTHTLHARRWRDGCGGVRGCSSRHRHLVLEVPAEDALRGVSATSTSESAGKAGGPAYLPAAPQAMQGWKSKSNNSIQGV